MGRVFVLKEKKNHILLDSVETNLNIWRVRWPSPRQVRVQIPTSPRQVRDNRKTSRVRTRVRDRTRVLQPETGLEYYSPRPDSSTTALSPSHRVDQVVDCGLWNVGPLLFNGCVKLLDIGRNRNTLSYMPIQSIPNMLNGWHVRWVCWPCKNWEVFSFQELCTDPCNMGPCINMLQHEVMVVDEWHNNGPQDLVTVSLCIQNAINKRHPCSLSITYVCPYHNPTATMGHSTTLTSANRSPTRRHTRCLPSALCSENQDSSVKSTPLQSTRRHRMWAFAHSSRLQRRTAVRSRPRRGRRACRWASLRWFLTVCAEIAQLYISLLIIPCIIYYVTNKETLNLEIFWLCKSIVAAAVRVAGLRRSWRWRYWMWRSWVGVVTRGLRLWGRLDVLQNSLKYFGDGLW